MSYLTNYDMVTLYENQYQGFIISPATFINTTQYKTDCLMYYLDYRKNRRIKWGKYTSDYYHYITQSTILKLPEGYHSIMLSFDYIDGISRTKKPKYVYFTSDLVNEPDPSNLTTFHEFPFYAGSEARAVIVDKSIKITHCIRIKKKIRRFDSIGTSFQLRFTFLKKEEVPSFVNDDLNVYDCSGENFKKFAGHLRCNFFTQCHRMEDEMGCFYNKLQCPPRYTLGLPSNIKTTMNFTGEFIPTDLSAKGIKPEDIVWDKASMIIKTSNLKGIQNENECGYLQQPKRQQCHGVGK